MPGNSRFTLAEDGADLRRLGPVSLFGVHGQRQDHDRRLCAFHLGDLGEGLRRLRLHPERQIPLGITELAARVGGKHHKTSRSRHNRPETSRSPCLKVVTGLPAHELERIRRAEEIHPPTSTPKPDPKGFLMVLAGFVLDGPADDNFTMIALKPAGT